MSKAGTWSFDTRMALQSLAYNNPFARVKKKKFSFLPALPSPSMSVAVPNPSRSPSRKLRQSFSEQISDMKTKLVRALSPERPDDGSSQYSRISGESLFQQGDKCAMVAASEGFRQRGCLGGKPIALSPVERERSGVRTLDEVSV